MHRSRTGFTLLELLVIIGIIGSLLAMLFPAQSKARSRAAQLKDATQLKQVHMATVVFSGDNRDLFPRPGLINRLPDPTLNMDVPGRGPEDIAQNHTGPMYSALVMMNYFTPELLVGPTEVNEKVVVHETFDYEKYNPASDQYWDPAFTVAGLDNAPPDATPCHSSYAHLALIGARMDRMWRNTMRANEPAFSNRGPGVPGNPMHPVGPDEPAYRTSQTLRLHGDGGSWSGNVIFNDNHQELHDALTHPEVTFVVDGAERRLDHLFACEFGDGTDNQQQADVWLGMFESRTAEATTAIHDYAVKPARATSRPDR